MGDPDRGDYRPDLHGRVEGRFRNPPPPEVVERALATECPDCNVNVFIEEDPDEDRRYVLRIAHDATCPWLAAHEAEQS